jgi:hypothetical protein
MTLGADIGRILQQYSAAQQQPQEKLEQDFDEVARHANTEELHDGLNEAFHSKETPPFGQMVSQLFSQGDTHQRTAMLNQLIAGLGPSVIGSLLGGSKAGGLSGMLGGAGGNLLHSFLNRIGNGQQVQLAPEEVDQLSPQQVEQIADRAEQENPGIVDQMSRFYAQNPTLVKALGGAALAIALGKMAQRNR